MRDFLVPEEPRRSNRSEHHSSLAAVGLTEGSPHTGGIDVQLGWVEDARAPPHASLEGDEVAMLSTEVEAPDEAGSGSDVKRQRRSETIRGEQQQEKEQVVSHVRWECGDLGGALPALTKQQQQQQQEQPELQAAGQGEHVEVPGDEDAGGARAGESSKPGRSWSMTEAGLMFSYGSERGSGSSKKSRTAAASDDEQRQEQQHERDREAKLRQAVDGGDHVPFHSLAKQTARNRAVEGGGHVPLLASVVVETMLAEPSSGRS